MKRQYHMEMQSILYKLPKNPPPKLLLHSCCGPCSTAVLESLTPHFEILLYYYNPCIAPQAEFDRRLETQKQLLAQLNPVHPITLVVPPYDFQQYLQAVGDAINTPEGGERCRRCIAQRMNDAAQAALQYHCDYFTTTLSVSPHKNASYINECGELLAGEWGIPFLPSDFKKQGGYARSVALSHSYGLYRQDYCGCPNSLKEAEVRRLQHIPAQNSNSDK
ncbi:MAG: epoxyqueuosine reductase QueH [Oscillospiraceae bacterium]